MARDPRDAQREKETTRDALRRVEQMLSEIGAPSPAVAAGQQNAARANSRMLLAHAAAGKDCLASDTKAGGTSFPRGSSRARSTSPTQSQHRGAHMAGKDRAEKRYYGTGFNQPSAESPGPIYAAAPGFAEAAVSASLGHKGSFAPGCSFSRASRNSGDRSSSCTPGPNIYQLPASVGRQHQSDHASATSAVFTKAKRFNPKEFISRAHSRNSTSTDSPAPGAYDPPVSTFVDGPGVVFTGAKSSKQFISAGHVVDSLGDASPGPVYNIDAGSLKSSKYRSSPAFTMASSNRDPIDDPNDHVAAEDVARASDRCTIHTGANGKAVRECVSAKTHPKGICRHTKVQPFISREHSKVTGSSDTPGPAFYNPDDAIMQKRSASAVFIRDREEAKRFVSRELSTQKGMMSPGPIYDTKMDVLEKHSAAAVFAPLKSVPPADRFAGKVFLGPHMGANVGAASPGPIYDCPAMDNGPSFTIVHKERAPTKGIFPGPARVRWVSQELASENLGAYSPGPKYDIREDIGKNAGPRYSFGVSDREFGDHFTAAQKAKFGTAEHPSTCPAESRFVSRIMSNINMAGKASPGPQNPNVNPSDAFSSKRKAVQSVKLPPQIPHKSRKEEVEAARQASSPEAPLLYPNFEFGKAESPRISMTKAARQVGMSSASLTQAATAASGGAGATGGAQRHSPMKPTPSSDSTALRSYDVKYHLVEKTGPSISFGGGMF